MGRAKNKEENKAHNTYYRWNDLLHVYVVSKPDPFSTMFRGRASSRLSCGAAVDILFGRSYLFAMPVDRLQVQQQVVPYASKNIESAFHLI